MPYKLLSYTDFPLGIARQKYEKVLNALQQGDFRTADVKKMPDTGYFRAKLDREARLLFQFIRHGGEVYLLLLEVLPHHEYDQSRFLRGAEVSEEKLDALAAAEAPGAAEETGMRYLNPGHGPLHFLDKFISFDEDQQAVLHLPAPLIIIGSAGSGKTALTLERLKLMKGHVAYVSLSPYLVEHAQSLYYAQHYENERQEVDFLSLRDYLAGLRIPEGREMDFRHFEAFYARYRSQTGVREPYKLFEEFRGVLTGAVTDKPYLSAEEYLALGVRQSVFTSGQRPEVYGLFEKYLRYLEAEGFYDANILAFQYLDKVRPLYDHVIVDEVQDLTNIQLRLILQSLKNPVGFVLCGDANQIVHPNFFSWSALKTMFYKADLDTDIIRILRTNYRNAGRVTGLANTLLKIKNLRFGSIDKESTHLIHAASGEAGEVEFLEDQPKTKEDLNRKTQRSTRYAVLVMSNEDKAEARKYFRTPLIFSIQEAKGLEYENIILVNFISRYQKEFRVIAEDVSPEDLGEELVYARNRDKGNKELDTYKFYINALYVAMTRAVRNLYILEEAVKHPMLQLLGLVKARETSAMQEAQSSLDDWKREARKLEQQGKKEQSDAIRQLIAKQENKVALSAEELEQLKADALNPAQFNNQAKKKLFAYAVSVSDFDVIRQLEALKFPEARKHLEKLDREFNHFAADCRADKVDAQNRYVRQYGADFRNLAGMNGLFACLEAGSFKSLRYLLDNGADRMVRNAAGLTPLQETMRAHTAELAAQAYLQPGQAGDYRRNRLKNFTLTQPRNDGRLTAKTFARTYDLLRTHTLTAEAGGRQIRLSSQGMEYVLLNLLLGLTRHVQAVKEMYSRKHWTSVGDDDWSKQMLGSRLAEIALGLTMDDIMTFVEAVPEAILPAYRRKRPYVNAMLAKHEVDSNDPYNKQLFKRTARGIYMVNPELRLVSH